MDVSALAAETESNVLYSDVVVTPTRIELVLPP